MEDFLKTAVVSGKIFYLQECIPLGPFHLLTTTLCAVYTKPQEHTICITQDGRDEVFAGIVGTIGNRDGPI